MERSAPLPGRVRAQLSSGRPGSSSCLLLLSIPAEWHGHFPWHRVYYLDAAANENRAISVQSKGLLIEIHLD